MSTTNDLIGRVRTRMALVAAVEDLERGAAWSAGVALVTLALTEFGVVVGPAWWAFAAGAAVAVAIPLAGLLVRRRDESAVTAVADERLGLRERLSTALWWRQTQSADAAQFGPLVVADADAVAARVAPNAVARAFRPRLLRRPMIVAAALLAACGVGSIFADRPGPIGETEAARVVRLADANRIAEVARKLRDAAKRVEEDAVERKEGELAKVAEEIRKKAEPLTRSPTPPREEALRQINAMADVARKQASQLAGLREPSDSKEAAALDRDLDELLENMSNVGLESLQRDLRALEERIKKGEKGQDRPSGDDVRDLAKRLDSLRKAMERAAAAAAAGDESVLRKLRKFGNEELLAKVAQRLRELAARMDRGQNYDDLQSEAQQQEEDLSQMSEEDLKKLLSELDQLAAMKNLEEMVRQGGGEMSGGRKLRIDGVGRRGGGDKSGKGGRGKGGKGETAGQDPGSGPGGEGQGTGKRPADPNDPTAFQAENVKGKIDPKGRISVTSFRGLPKPGEVTVELREALQRARDDAQAPLDTEEIPRRYRDGIREYFDDLGRSK